MKTSVSLSIKQSQNMPWKYLQIELEPTLICSTKDPLTDSFAVLLIAIDHFAHHLLYFSRPVVQIEW